MYKNIFKISKLTNAKAIKIDHVFMSVNKGANEHNKQTAAPIPEIVNS